MVLTSKWLEDHSFHLFHELKYFLLVEFAKPACIMLGRVFAKFVNLWFCNGAVSFQIPMDGLGYVNERY